MKSVTKNRGRPTVFNVDVVHKLEQALAIGCTVDEACSFSGVSRSAYYKKLEEDSYFMDKMERARLFMIVQSRHTVCNAIRNGDIKTSMWYLERKLRNEFSQSTTCHCMQGQAVQDLPYRHYS